ncbi:MULTISPECIES: glycosyltransferase family 2 protein [Comamonas]|uniref:glycosyltransferase family 2 protein n=1 Tax=Comamonas TaxID=283 RepID=UPI001B46BB4D|nr:glycosyltransferase family 2 protein [Comamonas aquatica]MBP7646483.1 glycosyltransferase family 2 protein [Comamonas sp.]MDE1556424.1 glycosyltransferase family 2 protein [Comamonas aquatica]MDH0494626.1 glycosyltransferase family 2 protein [Comamonas aquatica]
MSLPMNSKPTLTVAVLTLNEAKRIRACLESAQFADQLLVVDSGSTDDTVKIAREMGAEVLVYPDWQGFAVQRNRLLQHATGDFIFFLDADEVMGEAFQRELQAIVAAGQAGVWKIRWRMVAFGRELKYLRSTSLVERLFVRKQVLQFTGVVHEEAQLSVDVPRFAMKSPLLHYSRDSVRDSLQKLTQYSMLGAAKRAEKGKRGGVLRGLASGTSMFIRLYILHLGFLCGGAGFLYCLFVALEAFFRYAALGYDEVFLSNVKRS